MLKFLRKYNKILLVFFGVFLMIAFLAPQAVQRLGQFTDSAVGTLDGETVMRSDLNVMEMELAALDTITPLITQQILPFDRGTNRGSRAVQWMLLSREAEQGGFYGSDMDGRTWLPELARAVVQVQAQIQGVQLPPEQVIEQSQRVLDILTQQVSRARRPKMLETEQEVLRVLAKARGVSRLSNAVINSPRLSGTRLASEAVRELSAVTADLLVLDARDFSGAVAGPDEAAIVAHFEAFKDVPRGEGEYGMGYRLPTGVTMEWLTIDRQLIFDLVEIDTVEARKQYERNRELYVADFAGERATIVETLKQKRVEEIVEAIDRLVRGEVLRSLSGVPELGVYRDLPEDWASKRVSYETLANKIVTEVQDRFEVTIPLPVVSRRSSEVLTQQDILQVPGLGQSQVRVGSAFPSFAAAAFEVKELRANPDVQIQVGLTAIERPAEDATGRRYYYRLLDAREEQAPSEMTADLRGRIVDDLRAIAAFEMLLGELDVLERSLARSDFETVKTLLPEGRVPEVEEGVFLRRQGASSRSLALRDPELTSELVDEAYQLNIYQAVDEQDAELQVIGAASSRALSIVVGRVTRLQPLSSELYQFQRGGVAQGLRQRDFQTAIAEQESPPFSLDRLMERHGYVPVEED